MPQKLTLAERMTRTETQLEDLRKDVIEPMAGKIDQIYNKLNNGMCSQVESHEKRLAMLETNNRPKDDDGKYIERRSRGLREWVTIILMVIGLFGGVKAISVGVDLLADFLDKVEQSK